MFTPTKSPCGWSTNHHLILVIRSLATYSRTSGDCIICIFLMSSVFSSAQYCWHSRMLLHVPVVLCFNKWLSSSLSIHFSAIDIWLFHFWYNEHSHYENSHTWLFVNTVVFIYLRQILAVELLGHRWNELLGKCYVKVIKTLWKIPLLFKQSSKTEQTLVKS